MINTGTTCEVCNSPNPALFGQIEEDPLWECKFCKVPNEQVNNRCIACGKLRQ